MTSSSLESSYRKKFLIVAFERDELVSVAPPCVGSPIYAALVGLPEIAFALRRMRLAS
jgi:hypothetical protein